MSLVEHGAVSQDAVAHDHASAHEAQSGPQTNPLARHSHTVSTLGSHAHPPEWLSSHIPHGDFLRHQLHLTPEQKKAMAHLRSATKDFSKAQKQHMDALIMAQGCWHDNDNVEDVPDGVGLCSKMRKFILGGNFDVVVGGVVMANALVMILKLEYDAIETARKVRHPDFLNEGTGEEHWAHADDVFYTFEVTFAVFFIIELLLRLRFVGMAYLKAVSNWIDIGIVLLSVLDFFRLSPSGNMTFLRLIRIVKLAKVLRIVRALKLFRHLRLLLLSIRASFGALFWSMVLLLFLIMIASIFMTQTLAPWLQDEDQDQDDRHFVYEYFGSFARSTITMFQITLTPGVFGEVARRVIYHVHKAYGMFFVGYVCVVSFAVIRVITALFIRETLEAAQTDVQMVHSEVLRQREQHLKKVGQIFNQFDKNGDGQVSTEELNEILSHAELLAWFKVVDVEPKEAEGFLRLSHQSEGTLSHEAFVNTVMRMKGNTSKLDVATLLLEQNKLKGHLDTIEGRIKRHGEENMLEAVRQCMHNAAVSLKNEVHEELMKSIKDVHSEFASVTRDLRQSIAQIKHDVKLELGENTKVPVKNDVPDELMKSIKDVHAEFTSAARDLRQSIAQIGHDVNPEFGESTKVIIDAKEDAETAEARNMKEHTETAEARLVEEASVVVEETSVVHAASEQLSIELKEFRPEDFPLWHDMVQVLWRWRPKSASGENDASISKVLQPYHDCPGSSTPRKFLPQETSAQTVEQNDVNCKGSSANLKGSTEKGPSIIYEDKTTDPLAIQDVLVVEEANCSNPVVEHRTGGASASIDENPETQRGFDLERELQRREKESDVL